MANNPEQEKKTEAKFPEPRAFFKIGENGQEVEIKYSDSKNTIQAFVREAQEFASKTKIDRKPLHTGRLPSKKEITQAREAQRNRINRLPHEIENRLLSSNPDNPLTIKITHEAALKVIAGKSLREDEISWRTFLIKRNLTHLWGKPWIDWARKFFLARLGKKDNTIIELLSDQTTELAQKDNEFKEITNAMNDYFRAIK